MEFEEFGNINFIKIIWDFEGKSKGYGFIEFKHTSDFKWAYRSGNQKIINGRKIVVDAEYGRTNKYFIPMRLGGGLGKINKTNSNSKFKLSNKVKSLELKTYLKTIKIK